MPATPAELTVAMAAQVAEALAAVEEGRVPPRTSADLAIRHARSLVRAYFTKDCANEQEVNTVIATTLTAWYPGVQAGS